MKNLMYERMIREDHNIKCLTLEDFIEVCDRLELPVFEVQTVTYPIEPFTTREAKIHKNMSEYRKTMLYTSARDYDYEHGLATYYLRYDGILDGAFEVVADDNSADYKWNFEVVGNCVVVNSECNYK